MAGPIGMRVINFNALAEEGMISAEDLQLFSFVDSAEQACRHIFDFYSPPQS